jgi:hypothetical protein
MSLIITLICVEDAYLKYLAFLFVMINKAVEPEIGIHLPYSQCFLLKDMISYTAIPLISLSAIFIVESAKMP